MKSADEKLLEIISVLDKATGDTDANVETDEEYRDEYPVHWAMQKLCELRESLRREEMTESDYTRPPAPETDTEAKVAADWYTWGFQRGMLALRREAPPDSGAEARLREALATVEDLIRRDPACFNLSDELQSVRSAIRHTLSAAGDEAKESEKG